MGTSLSSLVSIGSLSVVAASGGLAGDVDTLFRPFRPPQWIQSPLTIITVPGSAGTTQDPSTGAISAQTTASTMYVFDAVLRAEHEQEIKKTQHPVQTGANIADHAFIMPAQLVLEIGMSDSMDSYQSGMWSGNASKSVSAFQELKKLAAARVPLTITTRLQTYTNMLIESIHAPDTNQTRYGLRATVTFGELYVAQVVTTPVSARPQDSNSTPQGATQGVPVTSAITSQNGVPPSSQVSNVPGAGDWSSTLLTP